MTVYYTETERETLGLLISLTAQRAQANQDLYVASEYAQDGCTVTSVGVWRSNAHGDRLQVSFPSSPCPDVARLNAYRWIVHELKGHTGRYFHAWEPQHVKQLAEAKA